LVAHISARASRLAGCVFGVASSLYNSLAPVSPPGREANRQTQKKNSACRVP